MVTLTFEVLFIGYHIFTFYKFLNFSIIRSATRAFEYRASIGAQRLFARTVAQPQLRTIVCFLIFRNRGINLEYLLQTCKITRIIFSDIFCQVMKQYFLYLNKNFWVKSRLLKYCQQKKIYKEIAIFKKLLIVNHLRKFKIIKFFNSRIFLMKSQQM